jgi:hypothetical protein
MFSIAVQERAMRMVFDTKVQYPSQVVAESNVSLMGLTRRSSADGEWLLTLQSRCASEALTSRILVPPPIH